MSHLPDDGSEWVQASIEVPELDDPAAQAEVLKAVQGQSGVQTVTVTGRSLRVVYDPLRISEHELERLVKGSGHATGAAEVERDSPFAGED